jgi:murein DD-endopeptidase MepM/ murein hydrolase activator NlpD
MSSSKRRCQPTSFLKSNAAAGSKLGFAAVCVVFAAGCSADVTRFDLGSPNVSSGYAPSDAGGSSNGSYGRDPSYGSAGSNRNSTSGYTAPRSYGDNTVARQELDVPRETSALPQSSNQSGSYEGGRYDSAHYRPSNQNPGNQYSGNQYQGAAPVTEQPSSYAPQQSAGYAAPVEGAGTKVAALHGAGDSIEVQQGDTLYSLSRRHQVSVSELMSANRLSTPSIKPGQKLYLPSGPSAKAAPRAPAASYETAAAAPAEQPAPAPVAEAAEAPADWSGSHTVKPGESLYAIARENKIKLTELERHNGIADSRKVKPGTVLKVPGNGSSNGSSDTVASNADTRPSSAPATIPVRTQSMSEASSPPPTASSVAPAMLNGNGSPPPSDNRVAKLETPGTMSDAGSSTPSQGEGSVAGSKLRWPVAGKVVSTFGPRPDGTHNDGVNVAAPLGTDVHAAESGVVAYAGDELKGYGNLVLIRHDNGWVTAYAHADEIMVKRGDRIKRGQVIAKAGRTGQVDQPQVHFELRQGQKPVDPTPFMERM